MITKNCITCGAPFEVSPSRHYYVRCPSCFRDHIRDPGGEPQSSSDAASLKVSFDALVREHGRMARVERELKNQVRAQSELILSLQNEIYDLEVALQSRSAKSAEIPAEIKRRLVSLCHPDRHGNSQLANRVTVWLLSGVWKE